MPRPKLDIFYVFYLYTNLATLALAVPEMIAGVENENGSRDSDHNPFEGDLSSGSTICHQYGAT